MVVRWIVSLFAFLISSAVVCQSYPGYFIDRDGNKKDAVFIVRPALFSSKPDFGSIVTGIRYIENGRKVTLTPGMCQSVYLRNDQEEIEFLSMPNLIGKKFHNSDSVFLRPRIIGPATLYYYYYVSHSPLISYREDGSICTRKNGPLSITKQGWIIAREDGTALRITRRTKRKLIAGFFRDYERLASMILSGDADCKAKNTEKLVVDYNDWKNEQELLRANMKK